MKPRTLQEEKNKIDKALDEFTNDCRARLCEMAERGKRGWDNINIQDEIAMEMMLDADKALEHGDRLHLHDIANRAMMLWWQAWREN